ncbi:DNA-binding response regulator [Pedobacter sp. KBW06]|uniref:LytR/AlgR family response regulator transcription factor n=1 Tax=Pedobacter sp. KBW06 TaxID=2153359 RepID=UPI000F59B0B1|nr:LytTR family DNA-binding domain-containing protein [Pedobacter sp. KBW06]RQO75672.1 DNA-binding response regulator [Pedobacter sp. KBW06]
MIRCLVLDDEQHAVDLLVSYIKRVPFLELAYSSTDPLEALAFLNTADVDLIFSDIEMPELSGLEFTKALRGKHHVVFTTAYSKFAMEGFEHDVLDFLLKPIIFPRFLKSAQKAMTLMSGLDKPKGEEERKDYFFVKTEQKGKLIKINFDEIDYVEGMRNYVGIYKNGELVQALMNMKDLESLLPMAQFVRVHNSYIIRISRIQMIEGNVVRLKNVNGAIPIGITYKNAFMDRIK